MGKRVDVRIGPRIKRETAEYLETLFNSRNEAAEFILEAFPALYEQTRDRVAALFDEDEMKLLQLAAGNIAPDVEEHPISQHHIHFPLHTYEKILKLRGVEGLALHKLIEERGLLSFQEDEGEETMETAAAVTVEPMAKPRDRYVAYYRVSTQRQGASGLGLESQRSMVHNYLERYNGELISEYIEVETGTGSLGKSKRKRPQLKLALEEVQREKGILLIAKLDRLSRNVAFISALRESDVEFVCADTPHLSTPSPANRFMLNILASAAQYEAELISERTKAGLAVAKARGVKLGGDHSSGRRKTIEPAMKARLKAWRAKGWGYKRIQNRLNELGIPAPMGGKWGKSTTFDLVRRLEVKGPSTYNKRLAEILCPLQSPVNLDDFETPREDEE